MWLTLLLTGAAVVVYATERIPIELSSLGVLTLLLLIFHVVPPMEGTDPAVQPIDLLAGFANPALIAVSALLVIGQGLINTAALELPAGRLFDLARGSFRRALGISLGSITGTSGFMNNTPVVVVFIPIMRALAERFARPASAVMMPLSFAAILGGMFTLIGSSTNLLVAGQLRSIGHADIGFFDFSIPGLVLISAGLIYVVLLPLWLPRRQESGLLVDGKQFIAEIDVVDDSRLIGESSRGGLFPSLTGVTVRLIQRQDRTILPPFEDVTLAAGDILIVAATRKVLTEMLTRNKGQLLRTPASLPSEERQRGDSLELMLAEVMVKPASRMVGQSLELTNFPGRSRCTVLGIQRRARMLRTRLFGLRLEPGDVLLLLGRADAIERLRTDPDVLLMEWSASEMPSVGHGPIALWIFALVVVPAALGIAPIVLTSLIGVVALLATGCLNVRQAARAVDRRIVLLVASALALGTALEATGGAAYLAGRMLELLAGSTPSTVLSAFFLMVAIFTNVLSNNACAVLFTPIAINLAAGLEVDAFPFAVATILAANCSFATPIGYQTNLLVMGPGQYRFADFLKAGLPLIVLLWIVFSLFAPWYYGV